MRSARSFWRSPPNDVGRAGVGHAHVAGTGESGSISFSALRSAQQAAGMLAFSDATFSVTSLARAAPGITETTIGCARTNCNAAAGSETLLERLDPAVAQVLLVRFEHNRIRVVVGAEVVDHQRIDRVERPAL